MMQPSFTPVQEKSYSSPSALLGSHFIFTLAMNAVKIINTTIWSKERNIIIYGIGKRGGRESGAKQHMLKSVKQFQFKVIAMPKAFPDVHQVPWLTPATWESFSIPPHLSQSCITAKIFVLIRILLLNVLWRTLYTWKAS